MPVVFGHWLYKLHRQGMTVCCILIQESRMSMFLTDEFFMLRAVVDFDIHVNDKDFFAIIQTVKGKECKI